MTVSGTTTSETNSEKSAHQQPQTLSGALEATASADKPVFSYGFVTIVEVGDLGYAGGLLIVSPQGRPVEFHCTAPVAENRTQKILYGQTYHQYLFCDQIAASLVAKARRSPSVLVTDRVELMSMRSETEIPAAMLVRPDEEDAGDPGSHRQNLHAISTSGDSFRDCDGVFSGTEFQVNGETIRTDTTDLELADVLKEACVAFARSLPLVEPFERIQLAMCEARASAA